MRIDKEGNQITLEEDIREIWRLHGWDVIQEKVSGNTWKITVKVDESLKSSLNNRKNQSAKSRKFYCKNPECFSHYIDI